MSSNSKFISITTLYNEMQSAIACKDSSYNWLILRCKTQTDLASTDRKSINIIPMSLNTFKKYADIYIDGGYQEIDRTRKSLIKKSTNTVHIRSSKQKEQITNLKNKLEEAERTRAILLKAYNDLNRITMNAIASSPEYEFDYKRHNKLYSTYFGLNLVVDNG